MYDALPSYLPYAGDIDLGLVRVSWLDEADALQLLLGRGIMSYERTGGRWAHGGILSRLLYGSAVGSGCRARGRRQAN